MTRGDETRLFLLAELARRGQAHGHELRREARIGRTDLWTSVHVGSIYSTLRRLESEGLIEAVRSERQGLMPERTIYAVTGEGSRELKVLRDAMLRGVTLPADPFDLAFSVSEGLSSEELAPILDDRLAELESRAVSLARQRTAAAGYLDQRDDLLFDHLAERIETEINWHRAVREVLTRKEPPTWTPST